MGKKPAAKLLNVHPTGGRIEGAGPFSSIKTFIITVTFLPHHRKIDDFWTCQRGAIIRETRLRTVSPASASTRETAAHETTGERSALERGWGREEGPPKFGTNQPDKRALERRACSFSPNVSTSTDFVASSIHNPISKVSRELSRHTKSSIESLGSRILSHPPHHHPKTPTA